MPQGVLRQGRPQVLLKNNPMNPIHTFQNEDHAQYFSRAMNAWGGRRNEGQPVVFREGKTVYLRPEFSSKESMREFTYQLQAFSADQ